MSPGKHTNGNSKTIATTTAIIGNSNSLTHTLSLSLSPRLCFLSASNKVVYMNGERAETCVYLTDIYISIAFRMMMGGGGGG